MVFLMVAWASVVGNIARYLTTIDRYFGRYDQPFGSHRNIPPRTDLVITVEELAAVKQFWDLQIQREAFRDVLEKKEDTASKHFRRQLTLFIDNDGLIRCLSRYLNATTSDFQRFPKLLPKNNPYTDLVIRDCHVRLIHAGVRHTLAETRQEYWIIHGRNQVKKVLKACTLCRCYHGGHFRIPDSPHLPQFGITRQRPFETVGVDYLGPLMIRNRNSQESSKVWICLFTCATIRAVHLEAVDSLSTDQFLLCLRRFIAVYGRPRLIVCDNAKHFHLAAKTLSKMWQEIFQSDAVKTLSSKHGITWKFITELTPWMGGFYERMVGIVKSALKKSIHQSLISFVELQTILCEASSVVNSRPLLYDEDTVEGTHLTPSHFLLRATEPYPSAPVSEEYQPQPSTANALLLNWKRIQGTLDRFWKTWQASYLQSLLQSASGPKNRNDSDYVPKVGMTVIIKDNPQRRSWKLGRIAELISSQDEVFRSAVVRLPNGNLIRRPLKLIFPLEYSKKEPCSISSIVR